MTLHPLTVEQHPLIALLLVWGLAWLLTPRLWRAPHTLWLALPGLIVATFVLTALWYARQNTYFDMAEPTITAVAAMFRDGRPLYPALDAPEQYVHVYGPVLFLVQAFALTTFGATVAVSKAVGVAAAVMALAVGFWAFARLAGPRTALSAIAAWALLGLTAGNTAFWTRPDPLLALTVALGLAAAEIRHRALATLVLGLALGLAVNLKMTGPLYFLPIAVLFAARHGFPALCGSGAAATAVAIAPFALPNVSLNHYLDYLELSARNGLMGTRLRQNIEWAMFLLLPCLAATNVPPLSNPNSAGRRWFMPALLAAVLGIALVGAKPGGGPFHLLPFAPVLIVAAVSRPGPWPHALRSLVVAVVVTMIAMAIPRQLRLIEAVERRSVDAVAADVAAFAAAHPTDSIAVGYAGVSVLSQTGALLALASHDYWLDEPAVQEYRLSGRDVPPATLAALDTCRTRLWLLPPDTPPFAVTSAYAPLAPADVFSTAFRTTFLRRYARTATTNSFDVWTCQPPR